MEVKGVQGIAIDRCPNCFGMWFDKGELERIQKSGGTDMVRLLSMGSPYDDDDDASQPWNDLSRGGGKATADCPRCQGGMTRGHDDADDTLVIDQCPSCGGAWYDGGEVARHLEAIQAEGIIDYLKRVFRRRG
jgi:hypothetical protein